MIIFVFDVAEEVLPAVLLLNWKTFLLWSKAYAHNIRETLKKMFFIVSVNYEGKLFSALL